MSQNTLSWKGRTGIFEATFKWMTHMWIGPTTLVILAPSSNQLSWKMLLTNPETGWWDGLHRNFYREHVFSKSRTFFFFDVLKFWDPHLPNSLRKEGKLFSPDTSSKLSFDSTLALEQGLFPACIQAAHKAICCGDWWPQDPTEEQKGRSSSREQFAEGTCLACTNCLLEDIFSLCWLCEEPGEISLLTQILHLDAWSSVI